MTKPFRTTVTGSFPRPIQPEDTLRKPELSRQEADDVIRWAVREQVEAGLLLHGEETDATALPHTESLARMSREEPSSGPPEGLLELNQAERES